MVLAAPGEDVEGHYHCDKNVNIQCAWNENGLIFSFDCVGLVPCFPIVPGRAQQDVFVSNLDEPLYL